MGLFRHFNDRFIDMHIHVLPGVDDGSRDIEMSLDMLRIAGKNGITDMIVTPHYKNGRHNADSIKIDQLINELTARMREEGITINLYPGNEIFYYDGVAEELEDGKVLSMNGTDRVLVEFMPGERYQYIRNAVDAICGAGFVPIIAHIERYECMLDDISHAREISMMGAEIQINAAAVEGRLGHKVKKYVTSLLKERLVTYVGTDSHDADKRAPETGKCIATLHKLCDEKYVTDIVCDNALAIINA